VVANDGREALAMLERSQFDLVLMDIQMPRMDGVEATRTIRNREKTTGGHIPIIAMTAFAMTGDREKYIACGMDGYIAKPIQSSKLFEVIEGVVEGTDSTLPQVAIERPTDGVVDIEAALANLDGKERLLRKIASMFLQECPQYMAELRQAVGSRDAEKVMQAAHRFKGVVGAFEARVAFEAAGRLEHMGLVRNLALVDDALAEFETDIDQLRSALCEFIEESAPA